MAAPNSTLGMYRAASPVGTGHALEHLVNDLARNVASATTPTGYGFTTVAGSDANPNAHTIEASLAPDGTAGDTFVPLFDARDMAALSFVVLNYDGTYHSANNQTLTLRLWLVHEISKQNAQALYDFEYLGKLTLTVGSVTVGVGDLGASGCYVVDTIAVTEDVSLSPGIRVTGQPATPANNKVWAQFDSKGAIGVYVRAGEGSDAPNMFLKIINRQV